MKAFISFISLISIAICIACNPEKSEQNVAETKTVLPAKIQEPFRFHKAIEVKPGLTFDIVSWGRGSELVGGYLILVSDSTASNYHSVANDKMEGRLVDAWNMDMDSDGNPEIFLQSVSDEDGKSYLKMYVYEFDNSGSSQQIRFPDLLASTMKQYHGKDSLYIKEGALYREFPLYDEADIAAAKPIGKKVVEYTIKGNSFSVKEIKQGE